jgi:PAS domain S-box-containing protein
MPSGDDALSPELLEVLPGGVVQLDATGKPVALNREALRVLGVPEGTVIERTFDDWASSTVREDGSPCPPAEYPAAIALQTGEPSGPLTLGLEREGGETTWCTFRASPIRGPAGEVTGVLVGLSDVTDRVIQRERLARSEARWRALAEHLPDFVVVCDRAANIVFANRVLEHLPEVVGLPVITFVDPKERESWMERFERVVATGKACRFETWGEGAGGRVAPYETLLSPVKRDDEVERVIMVARDTTERQEVLSKVAEHERLASVGLLAASVAHEVMNPLTYVLASLDFALSERADPLRRERAIRDAREGAMRVKQIAQDLRTIGRPSAEEMLYVDVARTFEMALRLAGPEVAPRARVIFDFREVPNVVANEARLAQVFINILVNAAHAIEEARREDGRIVARVFPRDDGSVAVAIEDEGVGIAPESLGRIFEPFYTSKSRGTGLGLSICREIVERMGGSLLVESEHGVGSTFTVVLRAHATARARRRVLLVESDAIVGGAIARALETSHAVTIADGLSAASSALGTNEHDAVVWSAALTADQSFPWAPLLDAHPGLSRRILAVITANTDPPDGVPSLRKPFARDELIRALDDLFEDG